MFLRGLNMIVIPLVFHPLPSGWPEWRFQGSWRIAGKTFAFYIVTTLIAATIGLTLVNIVKPGVGADLKLTENVLTCRHSGLVYRSDRSHSTCKYFRVVEYGQSAFHHLFCHNFRFFHQYVGPKAADHTKRYIASHIRCDNEGYALYHQARSLWILP